MIDISVDSGDDNDDSGVNDDDDDDSGGDSDESGVDDAWCWRCLLLTMTIHVSGVDEDWFSRWW